MWCGSCKMVSVGVAVMTTAIIIVSRIRDDYRFIV